MKSEDFLKAWKWQHRINSCSEMTCTHIAEFAEAYAKHVEETSWIGEEAQKPPIEERWKVQGFSVDVLTKDDAGLFKICYFDHRTETWDAEDGRTNGERKRRMM